MYFIERERKRESDQNSWDRKYGCHANDNSNRLSLLASTSHCAVFFPHHEGGVMILTNYPRHYTQPHDLFLKKHASLSKAACKVVTQ